MSFLFLVGVVLTTVGVWYIIKKYCKRLRCTGITEGKIAYLLTRTNMNRNTKTAGTSEYFFPVYEFEVNGEVFQVEGEDYSLNKGHFQLGTPGEIRYNPANPKEAVVNRKIGILNGVIFLIMGVILIVLG